MDDAAIAALDWSNVLPEPQMPPRLAFAAAACQDAVSVGDLTLTEAQGLLTRLVADLR